jgi:SMC proteins Flexible Hinge Domain
MFSPGRWCVCVCCPREQHSIAGVYGPLCELFTCSQDYYTAVEAAAGGSIFNVVVDTDATAARVLDVGASLCGFAFLVCTLSRSSL